MKKNKNMKKINNKYVSVAATAFIGFGFAVPLSFVETHTDINEYEMNSNDVSNNKSDYYNDIDKWGNADDIEIELNSIESSYKYPSIMEYTNSYGTEYFIYLATSGYRDDYDNSYQYYFVDPENGENPIKQYIGNDDSTLTDDIWDIIWNPISFYTYEFLISCNVSNDNITAQFQNSSYLDNTTASINSLNGSFSCSAGKEYVATVETKLYNNSDESFKYIINDRDGTINLYLEYETIVTITDASNGKNIFSNANNPLVNTTVLEYENFEYLLGTPFDFEVNGYSIPMTDMDNVEQYSFPLFKYEFPENADFGTINTDQPEKITETDYTISCNSSEGELQEIFSIENSSMEVTEETLRLEAKGIVGNDSYITLDYETYSYIFAFEENIEWNNYPDSVLSFNWRGVDWQDGTDNGNTHITSIMLENIYDAGRQLYIDFSFKPLETTSSYEKINVPGWSEDNAYLFDNGTHTNDVNISLIQYVEIGYYNPVNDTKDTVWTSDREGEEAPMLSMNLAEKFEWSLLGVDEGSIENWYNNASVLNVTFLGNTYNFDDMSENCYIPTSRMSMEGHTN